MRAAFHFDESIIRTEFEYYLAEPVLRFLCSIPPHRRHYWLRTGYIATERLLQEDTSGKTVAERLTGPYWSTLAISQLLNEFPNKSVYTVTVESLSYEDAIRADWSFRSLGSYLGAMRVTAENPVHWAFYLQCLPHHYRLIGPDLRLLWHEFGGGDRDDWEKNHWDGTHLFSSVDWEDLGVRATIFDAFDTLEVAQQIDKTSELASNVLGTTISEVALRINDLDPSLSESLVASFERLESFTNSEDLAHASLSIRRFVEKLANILYPPRKGLAYNMIVDNAKYRNRLIAYVKDNQSSGTTQKLFEGEIDDLVNRLNKLDDMANKGLHNEVTPAMVSRTLLSLTIFSANLLSLRSPTLSDESVERASASIPIMKEIMFGNDDATSS